MNKEVGIVTIRQKHK